MNCPHCNTPNPPEALYCIGCNAPLPSPVEEKRQKRIAVVRAILTAAITAAFYFASMYGLVYIWVTRFVLTVPQNITQEEFMALYNEAFSHDSTYIYIISACICLLAAAAFFGLRRRSLADAANIKSAPPVKVGSALVCGLTLQIPIGIILAMIPFPEAVVENHNEVMNAATSPIAIQLLYSVIIAPIVEEVFFRGIAHDRLSRVMPVPLAAIVSSAAFSIIHGEILAILVAFVCGYALALLYSRFKTVLVPIAFHAGFNLLGFVVSYINDPILLIAAGIGSVALFIGSTYLLLKRDEAAEQ